MAGATSRSHSPDRELDGERNQNDTTDVNQSRSQHELRVIEGRFGRLALLIVKRMPGSFR